ncbi:MAG TPA: tetratricopeptide repeat protein [Candidatus Eisenbacteria bacterium]|jgi:predicted Zn-dependent protease|nr:tetratricopeptide repeat protein [Candidatus Eisenbacteria bacterium]
MSDEAKAEFERAVDLFGQGKKEEAAAALLALIGRRPDYADAYETLGMVLYKTGRLDEAIEWTEKLAALKPDEPMAHVNLSVFYMKKGMKERAEEEKAKATVLQFSRGKK